MIELKTATEMDAIAAAGRVVARALAAVHAHAEHTVGVTAGGPRVLTEP